MTSSTFRNLPEEIETTEKRPSFTLKDDKNIELACSIIKSVNVRYMEDELDNSVRFSFYSDLDMMVAYRNVRHNIDRSKESRSWRS